MASEATPTKGKNNYSIFSYSFNHAGRAPVLWGFLLLIPLLVIFGVWASVAPINSAAIAEGEVILNFSRKRIQHLEGGIIEDILVEEGQKIEAGVPIAIIRDVRQRSHVEMLYNRLAHAMALHARLIAERDDRAMPNFSSLDSDITITKELRDEMIELQRGLFETRRSSLQIKIQLIAATKKQAQRQIEGLEAQLSAVRKSFIIATDELEVFEYLHEKGSATLAQQLDKKKNLITLEGKIGSLVANIAQLQQNILSSDIQIIDLKIRRFNEVLDELQKNNLSIQDLNHQMESLKDQLERTVIKAPVQGRVMDIQVHTKGAVIPPGGHILDIVPMDDRLIIGARLDPNDIDVVTAGTEAKVLLSAYKAKKVPKLDGEVLTVSGDILTDKTTGVRYFLARVLVDDSILADLKNDVSLYPGMPDQVFFLAGERTLTDYLLSPVLDATYRAFREE